MRLGSFVRAIRSYIPERLDPSESDVRVTYRYHEGERASATDPAYPAEIDILQVVRVKDNREVLSTYAADRDCVDLWVVECLEHARRHIAEVGAAVETEAEDRAKARREEP